MGRPKETCMPMSDFSMGSDVSVPMSRRRRDAATTRSKLALDFKRNKIGTYRNPFINFLTEFRKVTPSLKMNGAQLATIGGEMWREMNDKQKAQFEIVECKRRRRRGKRAGGGGKGRGRKGRRRKRGQFKERRPEEKFI